MGAGKWNPNFWECMLLQTGAIILLPLLPICWAAAIPTILIRMAMKPARALSDAKDIGYAVGLISLAPFAITAMNGLNLFDVLKRLSGRSTSKPNPRPPFSDQSDRPSAPLLHGRNPYASLSNLPRLYQYSQLNGIDEFRLLVISPGSEDEELRGKIITAKFSPLNRPFYEALSYTWADESGDGALSCRFLCDANQSIIRITKNCEAAIRQLRYGDRPRTIWIDAICIDQSSETERTYQVSMMSEIYVNSGQVLVWTGKGTDQTDLLFDWLNRLKTEDMDYLLQWSSQTVAVNTLITADRFWNITKERLTPYFNRTADSSRLDISQEQLIELVREFFSRRWFTRVWVLQEVSLPDVRRTTVICGNKSTSALRALHALSLIYKDEAGSMIRIFVMLRKLVKIKTSHLLDILIETRDRGAGDDRDKIFAVLSIASFLDNGMFPELKADYSLTSTETFAWYSSFFIRQHGPGFFLSLKKSPSRQPELPSWAADWSVPWPNYKAVEGRDFPAGTRHQNDRDSDADVSDLQGKPMLTLKRPKILRGWYSLNGHLDGYTDAYSADVKDLGQSDVLIELYPGLAALLSESVGGFFAFKQTCPHALSIEGVEELIGRWNTVVVDGKGLDYQDGEDYLGPVETWNIL